MGFGPKITLGMTLNLREPQFPHLEVVPVYMCLIEYW